MSSQDRPPSDANADNDRLTIHDTQEWYDLYSDKRTDDLSQFFDRYLKGLDNGWENTPRVRVSLLGFNLVCDGLVTLVRISPTDLCSPTSPNNQSQTGHTQKLNTRLSS